MPLLYTYFVLPLLAAFVPLPTPATAQAIDEAQAEIRTAALLHTIEVVQEANQGSLHRYHQ